MSYIDADNDWIPEVARAALDAEYNRPNSWVESLESGNEHARAEVDVWTRLANDPAMKSVYKDLMAVTAFTEQQVHDFLDAAWGSRLGDLSDLRDGAKRTRALVPKIRKRAQALKDELEKLDGYLDVPGELVSLVALLQSADGDYNKPGGWLGRRYLVGEKHADTASESPSAPVRGPTSIRLVGVDDDGAESVVWMAGDDESSNVVDLTGEGPRTPAEPEKVNPYFWEGAPTLPNLMQAIVEAADAWIPTIDGPVGAALAENRKNQKTEYLRALVDNLKSRGFVITPQTTELNDAIVEVGRVVLGYAQHDKSDQKPLYREAMSKDLRRILTP